MKQFGRERKKSLALPLSAAFFAGIMLVFLLAVSGLEEDTAQRQQQELETALHRGILTCYALEGKYPESLQYLKEHYPLHYNEELFFVDYRVQGGNLMPDVTVLKRRD